jgi:hypothetical protein
MAMYKSFSKFRQGFKERRTVDLGCGSRVKLFQKGGRPSHGLSSDVKLVIKALNKLVGRYHATKKEDRKLRLKRQIIALRDTLPESLKRLQKKTAKT